MCIRMIQAVAMAWTIAAVTHNNALAGVGLDNAGQAEYVANSWNDAQNAGSGFGPWTLVGNATGGGFAGFFATDDSESRGIDNVGVEQDPPVPYATPGTEGYVWASYANKGDGIDRATAFRTLNESLDGAGDTLSVSYEHGFVNGLAGVALRTANVTTEAADYATGARAQFYFTGGDAVYTLEDNAGVVPLDGTDGLPFVEFTFFGVDVDYTLTGADTYDIKITKYNSEAGTGGAPPTVYDKSTHAALGGRLLAGTGTIDSVALFNADVEKQSDAFFNNLSYSTASGGGSDNAANGEYDFGWEFGTNGGSGFGQWEMATETDGGFAGQFIQSGPENGVDNIGSPPPGGEVWASYANQGSFADKSTQFRDFSNPLAEFGDTFGVSFEYGFIDPGGKVGVALRDRAVESFNETTADFNDEALFQFFFEGGDDTYTLVDSRGEVDTGVGFSFWGIDLDLTLTSESTYDLLVTRYATADDPAPMTTTLSGLTFASTPGDGTIESLSFFNFDAPTQSDVYFNSLSYENVTGGLTGDFNGDGTVDLADYTTWRDNLGADESVLAEGSGNGSSIVDAGDYSLWKTSFGQAGSGSIATAQVAVPEPHAGLAMLILATLAACCSRRRQ